jgi:hypothetical protein
VEVTCCVDVLTGAAHHYDDDAYGEYIEYDYSADSDEPEEYCACNKCMESGCRTQNGYDR